MALRLPRWRRRDPAPQGRHVRGTAPVSVPGAASALVVAAAPLLLVPGEPVGTAPGPTAPDAAPPAPEPVEPVRAPVPAVDGGASTSTVALGFADGASVELPADDPRVRSFREAADAVLELPRS